MQSPRTSICDLIGVYHSFPAQLSVKHKDIISKRIICKRVCCFSCKRLVKVMAVLLSLSLSLQETAFPVTQTLAFFLMFLRRRDHVPSEWVECLSDFPKKLLNVLPPFSHLYEVWGIRVPQSLCTSVLDRRKRHKFVLPPETAWRVKTPENWLRKKGEETMLGMQKHDEVSSPGKILPCLALQQIQVNLSLKLKGTETESV